MNKKEKQPARLNANLIKEKVAKLKTTHKVDEEILLRLERRGRLIYLSWEGESGGCFSLQIVDEQFIESIITVLEKERNKFADKNNDRYVDAIIEKVVDIAYIAAQSEELNEMSDKELIADLRSRHT